MVSLHHRRRALTPICAAALDVDVDGLLVPQLDTSEQALEIDPTLVRSSVIDVIAIDSAARSCRRSEIEGEMGDNYV